MWEEESALFVRRALSGEDIFADCVLEGESTEGLDANV